MLTERVSVPVAPALRAVMSLRVLIGPREDRGETPGGRARRVPILGGSFEGPNIAGRVCAGGADEQVLRSDRVVEIDARYEIEVNDGAIISVRNRGIATRTFAHAAPVFLAPAGAHDWLNRNFFVSTVHEREGGGAVEVHVFAMEPA